MPTQGQATRHGIRHSWITVASLERASQDDVQPGIEVELFKRAVLRVVNDQLQQCHSFLIAKGQTPVGELTVDLIVSSNGSVTRVRPQPAPTLKGIELCYRHLHQVRVQPQVSRASTRFTVKLDFAVLPGPGRSGK